LQCSLLPSASALGCHYPKEERSWKDADPDIPIYQQAKAEYKKLLATSN